MTLVAMLQLKSAIARRESRENLREDYPYIDNDSWLKWVTVRRDGGDARLGTDELPFERYPIKPAPGKSLHPMWQRAVDLGIVRIEEGAVRWA